METIIMRNLITTMAIISLAACGGKDDETGDTSVVTDDTSVVTDDTGTTGTVVDASFSLSGNAIDMQFMTPVSSGALCMTIADPTEAIAGGDLIVLTQTTIEADTGAWATDVFETDSVVGLFMIVSDCDGLTTVVFPTATGFNSYDDAGDGMDIGGLTSISISMLAAGGMNQSFAAAGSSMTLAANGAMAGFVFDADGATPVSGATVCGADCADTLYFDTAMADGLFTTQGAVNMETDASAMGAFVVPGASVYTYVVDDGGAHNWDSLLFGAVPGMVSFVSFIAN